MLSRFAPPLLLMALIFTLSAQPDLNSGLGTWDTFLRKGAHMVELLNRVPLDVFVLGNHEFDFGPDVAKERIGEASERRCFCSFAGNPFVPALIAIGFAVTDELHQTTVEGRHGTPVDVLIDSTGVALGFAAAQLRARRRAQPVE